MPNFNPFTNSLLQDMSGQGSGGGQLYGDPGGWHSGSEWDEGGGGGQWGPGSQEGIDAGYISEGGQGNNWMWLWNEIQQNWVEDDYFGDIFDLTGFNWEEDYQWDMLQETLQEGLSGWEGWNNQQIYDWLTGMQYSEFEGDYPEWGAMEGGGGPGPETSIEAQFKLPFMNQGFVSPEPVKSLTPDLPPVEEGVDYFSPDIGSSFKPQQPPRPVGTALDSLLKGKI